MWISVPIVDTYLPCGCQNEFLKSFVFALSSTEVSTIYCLLNADVLSRNSSLAAVASVAKAIRVTLRSGLVDTLFGMSFIVVVIDFGVHLLLPCADG